MSLNKQSLAALALAGFTTVAMVSHQAQAQAVPYMAAYDQEADLDNIVRTFLVLKLIIDWIHSISQESTKCGLHEKQLSSIVSLD